MLCWLLGLTVAVWLLIVVATLLLARTHNTANNINDVAQTVETTTEPANDACHLLALPAELRLEIYETIIASMPRPGGANKTVEPSIMGTCQQIRAEMLKVYIARIEAWQHEANGELHKIMAESVRRIAANRTLKTLSEEREKIKEARSTHRSGSRQLRWKYESLSQELVNMETGRPGRHQRWMVLCGELSGELEKEQNVFNT